MPRAAALMHYLKAVVENPGRPPMHLHEEAREAGWSDEQILEAIAFVALELMLQRPQLLLFLRPRARELALRRFGDYESSRTECVEIDERRSRRMARTEYFTELRQDVAYALRTLRRTPGFTVVPAASGPSGGSGSTGNVVADGLETLEQLLARRRDDPVLLHQPVHHPFHVRCARGDQPECQQAPGHSDHQPRRRGAFAARDGVPRLQPEGAGRNAVDAERAAGRDFRSSTNLSTSCFRMRPPVPVPSKASRSTS